MPAVIRRLLLWAVERWVHGRTEPSRERLRSMPAPHGAERDRLRLSDGRGRFREILGAVTARGADPGVVERWLWQLDDEPSGTGGGLPAPDTSRQVYLVGGAFSDCLEPEIRLYEKAGADLEARGYRIATIGISGRAGTEENSRIIAERLAAPPVGEEGAAVVIGYSKGATDIAECLVRYPRAAARVSDFVSVAGVIGGTPLTEDAGGALRWLLRWLPHARCPPGQGDLIDSLSVATRSRWLERHALPAHVRCYSVAAFTRPPRLAAALVPTWLRLLDHGPRNDGQVRPEDALLPGGTVLAYFDADHWSLAIDVEAAHPLLAARRDTCPFPRGALLEAILLQVAEGAGG